MQSMVLVPEAAPIVRISVLCSYFFLQILLLLKNILFSNFIILDYFSILCLKCINLVCFLNKLKKTPYFNPLFVFFSDFIIFNKYILFSYFIILHYFSTLCLKCINLLCFLNKFKKTLISVFCSYFFSRSLLL
ncbi:hypothetical protein V6Z11_D09G276500 [Gossypium hirsutum]